MKKIILVTIISLLLLSCSNSNEDKLSEKIKNIEINNQIILEKLDKIDNFQIDDFKLNQKIKCEGYKNIAEIELDEDIEIIFYSPEFTSCYAGRSYPDEKWGTCYGVYNILNKEKKGSCWTFDGYKSYIEDILKYEGKIYINL